MIDMTAYLSDQRDALRESLDCAVRREAIVATKLGEAREERDAFSKAHAAKCQQHADLEARLEQVLLYVEDALLVGEDDIGVVRDILYAALDAGRP